MRYCIQVRDAAAARRDHEQRGVWSLWRSSSDTTFDVAHVDLADKILAQVLSTSKGSDPLPKHADHLWPRFVHPNAADEIVSETEKYANEWRGFWVLVKKAYTVDVWESWCRKEVHVPTRVFWRFQPGAKLEPETDWYGVQRMRYPGGANFGLQPAMTEVPLKAARMGSVFLSLKVSHVG